jgi:hypothetical protein
VKASQELQSFELLEPRQLLVSRLTVHL